MNQTEMLHQMCHELLTDSDIRAICKNRGLTNPAASSRPVLESLFLSDAGVSQAMGALDRSETALLHLLSIEAKLVDVTFFRRLDASLGKGRQYGTVSQRFKGVFSKVKDRLVRGGILLMALEPESFTNESKMERWRFALPVQFARYLPTLIEAAKHLEGEGNGHNDAAREKLKMAVRPRADRETKVDRVEVVDGELRWSGQPFDAKQVQDWRKLQWQAETAPAKVPKKVDPSTLSPADAVLHILAGLEAGFWSDAHAMASPLTLLSGSQIDAESVCESGWRWSLLAKQEAEGRTWYRLAPPAIADTPPDQYLAARGEEGVAVDLDAVPFEALAILVRMSDQRALPGGGPVMLVTPNLVKLGKMADTAEAMLLVDWLQKNAPAFHQAFETVRQRRGKTILHENLSVARVDDLSLRVALEKALGDRLVTLAENFIAFPHGAVAEVKRLVAKMGHVVKERAAHEP